MANIVPRQIRFTRHVMYDHLFLFTVFIALMQVLYMLTPDCETRNSRMVQSTRVMSVDDWTNQRPEISQDQINSWKNSRRKVDVKRGIRDGEQEYFQQNLNRHLWRQDGPNNRKNLSGVVKQNVESGSGPKRREIKANPKPRLSGNILGFDDTDLDNFAVHRKRSRINQNSTKEQAFHKAKNYPNFNNRYVRLSRTNAKWKGNVNATDLKLEEKQNKCLRTILIFGGIKVIRKWSELAPLVAALKQQDNGDWSTDVSCDQCTVQLILSNRPDSMRDKDAVVFGMSPYSLKVKMSTFKNYDFRSGQLLVFYGMETPLRMRKWIPDVGSMPTDVVWSYASIADIRTAYGYYTAGTPLDASLALQNIPAKTHKRKLIAWMGSNCVKEVFWPRMSFVQKLRSHIPVDVYGKCGNLTCLPRLSQKCQTLMGKYKFYLALENAECDDYVTEKFWETALMHGSVPVVYGAPKAYYIQKAPPNSFIYSGDFKSVKLLADYLLHLDKNPTKYAKYLEWRTKGTVIRNYPNLKLSQFCGILPHVSRAREGQVTRKLLSETAWFNSCRNMRKGKGRFLATDIDTNNWVPW